VHNPKVVASANGRLLTSRDEERRGDTHGRLAIEHNQCQMCPTLLSASFITNFQPDRSRFREVPQDEQIPAQRCRNTTSVV
jgi:hypothetical protein